MSAVPTIAPNIRQLHAWLIQCFEMTHNDMPGLCWYGGGGFIYLEFMQHHFGCWAIISSRASGEETGRVNIGTYTNKEDIELLIKALKNVTEARTESVPSMAGFS